MPYKYLRYIGKRASFLLSVMMLFIWFSIDRSIDLNNRWPPNDNSQCSTRNTPLSKIHNTPNNIPKVANRECSPKMSKHQYNLFFRFFFSDFFFQIFVSVVFIRSFRGQKAWKSAVDMNEENLFTEITKATANIEKM